MSKERIRIAAQADGIKRAALRRKSVREIKITRKAPYEAHRQPIDAIRTMASTIAEQELGTALLHADDDFHGPEVSPSISVSTSRLAHPFFYFLS